MALNAPFQYPHSAETTIAESEGLPKKIASTSSLPGTKHARGISFEHIERPEEVQWVDWDGPDDPTNPKNWSSNRKWATTFVVSAFNFVSPASSAMIAPASEGIAHELGMTNAVLISMITSAFVLGYGESARKCHLVVGPMSEVYGRSKILKYSNWFYLIWNVACGFSTTAAQLLVFRFLAGVGGSAPLSVGGAVVGDLFHEEKRGRVMALYTFVSMLGPVVGPVCAGWITHRATWRWVFWSISLFDITIQLSAAFLLHETYPPVLLEAKAHKLRSTLRQRGAGGGYQFIRSVYDTGCKENVSSVLLTALARPAQLIWREPIVQLFSLYTAFVYGIFYLFLTRIPFIFSGVYGQTAEIAGLQYIALGVGLATASIINAFFVDRIYLHLRGDNQGIGEPEYRLPSMVPGTVLLPVGLLISGWSSQQQLHWALTDIGVGLIGMGMILNFQSMQTYVVDAFSLHAASALATISCLRSFAGFGFPLFGPAIFERLGYGNASTILAALAILIGCPAPWIFWKYGRRIRLNSRYAVRPSASVATTTTPNLPPAESC
ncbi:MFS polyamine transporter [Ephemerocybe angulata]|uniref:MFS polyamine transporter n=1 Tax=Ephemerocybe angulata TaxID=980116 RepID=A0A8H6HCR7_9AGAR|nr:MFS polyamine transporter [Tulosesus angulatus]